MKTNKPHPATDPAHELPRYDSYVAIDGSIVIYDGTADAAWIQSDAAIRIQEMA